MARIMDLWLLFFCTIGLLASLTLADDGSCTVRDGNKFYDLNPLKSKKDYVFKSPDGHEYHLNICRPVVYDPWALKVDRPDDVGGVTRREHGDFSLGYTNKTLTVRDGNPIITMSDGSPCPSHQHMHAATTIRFQCDKSVSGNGQPELISLLPIPEDNSCYFFIEWKTPAACPTSGRGWGILAILGAIAGILLVAYIIAGGFYNYTVLGLRGLDIIPRYSLFSLRDTIDFCRDCFERIKERSSGSLHLGNGGMGGWGRPTGNGGYRGLNDEEQAGMLSGPPGFLDEEDEDEEPPHSEGAPSTGMDSSGVIRL